ncbi:MAG: cell wall hydrolase, partial [Clostridiales bacterium]|nr:cell wall hydrolase [Clostridiales bacterium]
DTTDIIDTTDTENTEPNENQDEEISIYSNIGISIAGSFVNIREEATTDSKIMGKLYKDSAAIILDNVGDWYYIESGSVKGYVKSDYLKTGIPDDELINNYGSHRISVNASGLNVRKEPDSESKKITVVYQNERYPVVEVLDEWVKIDISDDNLVGYVSKEHVELLVDFEKAISKKEEEELLKLQKEEEEKLRKKQAEEKAKKETEIKQRDETDYTEEELKLLACLVHSEAGDQSYEGKLAVANVVLNRMKSKKFPNTMKDVIYQPGQFSVAKNGSLKKQLSNYENYSSKSHKLTIKAAKAALSGENNIGDRLYFHAYKMAVKKGYNKKKNSVKLEDHLFW